MPNESDSGNNIMASYIIRGFMALCSAVLVGMVGWIALNIADVPVIKNQITNIGAQITAQNTESKARLDDHEIRLRTLEKK